MEENNQRFLKACEMGQLSAVMSLIPVVDINSVEKTDGNSGLIIASMHSNTEIVNLLLQIPEVSCRKKSLNSILKIS